MSETDLSTLRCSQNNSCSYVPPSVAEAIYGSVPGARLDTSLTQWVVPCEAEIDMAVQIKFVKFPVIFSEIFANGDDSGKVYPLHPLDVVPRAAYSPTGCVGTFVPQTVAVGRGEL